MRPGVCILYFSTHPAGWHIFSFLIRSAFIQTSGWLARFQFWCFLRGVNRGRGSKVRARLQWWRSHFCKRTYNIVCNMHIRIINMIILYCCTHIQDVRSQNVCKLMCCLKAYQRNKNAWRIPKPSYNMCVHMHRRFPKLAAWKPRRCKLKH